MQIFNPVSGGGSASDSIVRVGSGLAVQHGGQLVGRSLVGIAPVLIDNPEGIGGDPQIRLMPQSMMIGSAIIDMAVTDEQPIHIQGVDNYIIRRVVIGNATAVPDAAARLAIKTAQGQTGLAILPAHDLVGLDPADRYRILDLPIALSLSHRAPVFFVKPTVINPAPLTVRVSVFGDALASLEY